MLSARNFHTTTWNSFRRAMAKRPGRLIAAATLLLAVTLAILVYSGPVQAQTPSDDATLSALTVSPKNIIGFAADRTSYEVGVASTVTQVTISATPNQSGANADITPADADGGVNGHQVNLSAGQNAVTVTVTAEDTTTEKTYTVNVNQGVTSAYGWKAQDDLDGLIAAGNDEPIGIWGNETTIWVLDLVDTYTYAYNRDGSRDTSSEFNLHADNADPGGAWSNGPTVWISDNTNDKLYAYQVSNGARQASLDLDLHTDNGNSTGLWSDGTTIWVADFSDRKLYAYLLVGGARQESRDIATHGNYSPVGIWSDNITMWVALNSLTGIYAYDLDNGNRRGSRDFTFPTQLGSLSPNGVWSDGETMWMADPSSEKVYAFNMPPSNDATLSTLTVSPKDIIGFAANRTEYAVGVASTVTQVTISATPTHSGGSAAITPDDADTMTDGHQVDLTPGLNTVTITVTAVDTVTTGRYFLYIGRGVTTAYGWKAEDDLDSLKAAGNENPWAIWSDDTTMWVADQSYNKLYAYNLSTKARDADKDFNTLDAANESPYGIWSDGTTMWVADWNDAKIYAYNLSTKARDGDKDFNTLVAADNRNATDIWSDGTTMWVADSSDNKIYAYNLSTKARDADKDFNTLDAAGNNDPVGIWSDGTTMWVADYDDDKLYAYNLSTKARDADKDFNTLDAAGNDNLLGIWSDDTTMWVTDLTDDKVYSYNMLLPPSTDATLSALTVSPKNIIGFVSDETEYDVGVASAVTQATITATANDGGATIGFSTADAGAAAGHQVDLSSGLNRITITVTAEDGNTEEDYDLYIGRGVTTAYGWKADEDLDGLVAAGNEDPRGMCSNGTTIWIVDGEDGKIYAYSAGGSRDSSKDFNTLIAAGNENPTGLWCNSTYMWVSDATEDKIYAYLMTTKEREPLQEFDSLIVAGNENPRAIWSDGTTMWVTDATDYKLYAYHLSTKTRDTGKDFNTLSAAGNQSATGMWSDGTTMWVVDLPDRKIYAYQRSNKTRDADKDFNTLSAAGNTAPAGMWGIGQTILVTDITGAKVYSYNIPLPPSNDATLRALSVSPKNIIGFVPSRTEYDVGVASTVTQATIMATANNVGATIEIDTTDAGSAAGHQVNLSAGKNTVTVTVTAQGGSIETYTVNINRGVNTQYGWKAQDDLNGLIAAENNDPQGIWSDNTTMWVADFTDEKLYAYQMSDGSRDSDKDFNTLSAAGNNAPNGIWSDSTTMWVIDSDDEKIYAYNLSTKARDASKDFDTLEAAGNNNPVGIWSDGTTMWVSDTYEEKLYAYNLSTKARDADKDFNTLDAAGNDFPLGIWSNGTTMWVADLFDAKLYAYRMSDKARDASKDFNTLSTAGNSNPSDIWSDDMTMWVGDSTDSKVYSYNIRVPSTDATLSALTVSPKNIIGFVPIGRGITGYDVGFASTVTQATITATTTDGGASIEFSTTDAGTAAGHQVDLSSGLNTVTITVTAADTVTTRPYSLYIGRGVTTAYGWKAEDDLNGLTAAGNLDPLGIWGNSATIWVVDDDDNFVYAYNRDGSRDTGSEFDLHSDNANARGAWSNGTTVWISDSVDVKMYAYRVSNGVRETGSEIDLDAENSNPKGVWSDGTTVWVADSGDDKLYAYRLSNGVRQPTDDISLTGNNTNAGGIWSNGVTMWVADLTDANQKIYAHNLDDGSHTPSKDFDTPAATGASLPFGLWSNGETMWMTDSSNDKVYSFNMPIRNTTGAPTISGPAEVGLELAAATASIRDPDGLTNPGYTYQWIRVDSDGTSNPTIITGASSRTYRLGPLEQGKKIKVRVIFADNAGNGESLTSAAYPASDTILAAPITDETRGYREPAVFHLITGINVKVSGGNAGYWIADIGSSISNANFKIGNTSHTVQQIYTRSNGELVFKSNRGIPEGLDFSLWNRWGTGGWTFSTTDAVAADNRKDLRWPNSGVSFQSQVAVELSSYRRASVNPPALRSVSVPADTNTVLDVTWDRPTDLLENYPGPDNAWLKGWRSTKNLKGYVVWAYHQTTPTSKRTWKEFVGPSTTRARLTRLPANRDIQVQVCLLFGNEAELAQRYDGPPYEGPCSETVVRRTTTAEEAQAPPALESQTVPTNGQSVQLRFDNPIYRNLLPGTDAFTVTVDGAPLDVSSLAASSDSRTLTLAVTPTIRSGRTVRVSYTTPTTGSVLEGRDGADVEDFAVGATNSSTVTASDEGVGPAPVSARVSTDGLAVVLKFDEPLHGTDPALERLTITINGVAVQPGFVGEAGTPSQRKFYLENLNTIRQGQTVTISYTDPSGNQVGDVIQDPEGNDGPPFTNFPVENLSAQLSQSADPPPEPLTVEFQNLPVSHDGTAFTFTLAFSEEFPVEAATVGAALDVTGGAITTAVQTTPPNSQNWQITVQPSAPDTAVTLFLVPKDGCTGEGTICTEDDRGLANGIGTFISAVPPLTAEFLGLPGSHGGGKFTFELRFSEDVTIGYRDLRDSIFVMSNGQVKKAKRIERGETQRWKITVEPSGSKDVTILLPVITICASGVICTEDDRPLSAPVLAAVPHTAETPAQQEEQNSPATGQPSIGGTAQAGEEPQRRHVRDLPTPTGPPTPPSPTSGCA